MTGKSVERGADHIAEFAAELTDAQDEISAALGNISGSPVSETEVPRNLNAILHIPVSVKVVLGSATMPVADLFKLGRGAIVPLDRRVGEPVDIVVNGHVIAARRSRRIERGGLALWNLVDRGGQRRGRSAAPAFQRGLMS